METARQAEQLVKDDPSRLVLMGVTPSRPATGYGYIRHGAALEGAEGAVGVESFHEKPDRATAESYIAAGGTSWNCGIFTWSAQRILMALVEHQPELATGILTIRHALGTDDYHNVLTNVFERIKAISIDHAVLEHSSDTCLLEASFEWHDLSLIHISEPTRPY